MTTFVEFLEGNALALVGVAVIAFALVVLFALGDDRPPRVHPTRPIATASDIREYASSLEAGGRDAQASAEPVALVGTPVVDDPLRAPFSGTDAVAYTVSVGSPLGHAATVRAATAFTLDVDGVRVAIDPGDPEAVVVDDDRRVHRRVHRTVATLDDETRDALAAHDTGRGRLARVLSGGVLPGHSRRTYRVRVASATDPIAVVGRLSRSADGDGWTLEPATENDENGALRFLDPASVTRDGIPRADDATATSG